MTNKKNIFDVVNFYHFAKFKKEELKSFKDILLEKGCDLGLRGLILLSPEGVNAGLSGPAGQTAEFLKFMEKLLKIKRVFYKKTRSFKYGFKKFRVKIKKEVVTLNPSYTGFAGGDLEPKDWEHFLNKKNVNVLDVRNDYEVELGRFKKARHLHLKEFKDFPKKLKKSSFSKEKPALIYCTGGVRCEKALKEMKNQGFKEVYQLKGGIIHYLKEYPHKNFKGECFVFDHRVALDQNLKTSARYTLCPHCGQAADVAISCLHCAKPAQVCKKCLKKRFKYLKTCTKNCAHHFRLKHKRRRSSASP